MLGRRADGYHELRSVVVPVALADRLEVAFDGGRDVTLEVTADPGIDLSRLGPAADNLAVRAAQRLRALRPGLPAGIRLAIRKRIPVGGGLGGGSADAAAVLLALDRLAGLRLGTGALMALGAELGSDVPALLHGGAVLLEGRGERVTPLLPAGAGTAPGFHVVIANPGICVPTCHAYQMYAGGLTPDPNTYNTIHSSVRSGDVHRAAAALHNGLERGVFAAYPETARLAARLKDAGGLGVLLCGSGASVFALVRDEAHGEAVRRQLGAGVWSVLTTTLPDGVMAAHGPLEP